MQYLKQSTSATLKLGPFLDDTDGKTPETGLTISQADVRLSKNGGDFAQKNESSAATHDEFGYYDAPIDTTDTETCGRFKVAVSESGALPVWAEYMVVPANVYDSIIGGTDSLEVDAIAISGDSTAADDLELLVENSKGTDHKILISSDAQDLSGTFDTNAKTVGDKTGYSISGTKTTLDALNDISAADVNSEVDDVINTDAKAELSSIPAANASLGDKIALMAMATRNGGDATSSQIAIFKDDGSDLGTGTISDDDTTFSRGKLS